MEGIEQNPIVYELMSEMAFRDKKVEVPVMFICSLVQLFEFAWKILSLMNWCTLKVQIKIPQY